MHINDRITEANEFLELIRLGHVGADMKPLVLKIKANATQHLKIQGIIEGLQTRWDSASEMERGQIEDELAENVIKANRLAAGINIKIKRLGVATLATSSAPAEKFYIQIIELDNKIKQLRAEIEGLENRRSKESSGIKKEVYDGVIAHKQIGLEASLKRMAKLSASVKVNNTTCHRTNIPIEKTKRERVGQTDRKRALKMYNDPEAMFQAIKAEQNALLRKEPDYQQQQLAELLALDEAEHLMATSSKASQGGGSKKGGSSKRGKKKKGKKSRMAAPTKASPVKAAPAATTSEAEAGCTMTLLQQLVHVEFMGSKESEYSLDPRVKRWDKKGLTEAHIAGWRNYKELDEEGRKNQVFSHIGIGMHHLLGNKKLREHFIFDSPDGPIAWCSVDVRGGEVVHGKLHFVVDEDNIIFHRMFIRARPGELAKFLALGAKPELKAEEDLEDYDFPEELVGKFSVAAEPNGDLKVDQPGHAYITGFTIRSFK